MATLARAEGFLLVPLLAWPLALWAIGLRGWRERGAQALVASVAAAAVLAPWVVPNLFRFEHPTTLSTQLGPTLDVANCDPVYSGQALGSWSYACALESDTEIKAQPEFAFVDRSAIDKYHREKAIRYARDHADRLPVVVAARLGRTFGFYVPADQLLFDQFAENRPGWSSKLGLGMYYGLAVASIAAVVVLRRRRVPSFPLVAQLVNVAITVVAFYGSTRFRAPAEPALVLLGAVAIDALIRRLRHEPDPPGPNPPGAPAEPAAIAVEPVGGRPDGPDEAQPEPIPGA